MPKLSPTSLHNHLRKHGRLELPTKASPLSQSLEEEQGYFAREFSRLEQADNGPTDQAETLDRVLLSAHISSGITGTLKDHILTARWFGSESSGRIESIREFPAQGEEPALIETTQSHANADSVVTLSTYQRPGEENFTVIYDLVEHDNHQLFQAESDELPRRPF